MTNEQLSVRGLVPFSGRASIINRQYTRCALSVSVLKIAGKLSCHNNSLYTLSMLIKVFQVDTDTPIKYGVKSYPIQSKHILMKRYYRAAAYTLCRVHSCIFLYQCKQFTYWLTNSINNNINLFLRKEEDKG